MFTLYLAWCVIFDENILEQSNGDDEVAMIVAMRDCGEVDQEHFWNGVIDVDITVKAARSDVDKKWTVAS